MLRIARILTPPLCAPYRGCTPFGLSTSSKGLADAAHTRILTHFQGMSSSNADTLTHFKFFMALQINSLLTRYAHLALPDHDARVAVTKVLKERLGVELPLQKVSVERGVVFLNTSSIIKSEVSLQKIEILAELHCILGDKKLKDIR